MAMNFAALPVWGKLVGCAIFGVAVGLAEIEVEIRSCNVGGRDK